MDNALVPREGLHAHLFVAVPGFNGEVGGPRENHVSFQSQGPDRSCVPHIRAHTLKLVVLEIKVFLWKPVCVLSDRDCKMERGELKQTFLRLTEGLLCDVLVCENAAPHAVLSPDASLFSRHYWATNEFKS